jgi:mRNA interferase MazF
MVAAYVPDRAHIIKIDFNPQPGHEQAGWRPALVLSPKAYNDKAGLAIVLPITNHIKGYPFEIPLPANLKTTGAIVSDHIKSLDWKARKARYVETLPWESLRTVQAHLKLLLGFHSV